MKAFVLAAICTVLWSACDKPGPGRGGASTEKISPPPPSIVAALPADHEAANGRLVAADLRHGSGAEILTVRRSWAGTDTSDTHFGAGWSDMNSVRLTQVDKDVVLIWRGGGGWRTAVRNGGTFAGDDGEKIERTADGWIARMPHGLVLSFDADGRLISEKPQTGAACIYGYDTRGRLVSVGTRPDNSLTYQYGADGRRVASVSGPEGLHLDYRYDEKGRLAGVTNSRRVRIEYRYADDGTLVSAKDHFGNELAVTAAERPRLTTAPAVPRIAAATETAKPKYAFDDKGRVKSVANGPGPKSYEYDDAGRMSVVTTPAGRAGCTYDAFGRVAVSQQPDGTAAHFKYNNLDLPTLIAKSDGTAEKFLYDEYGRLLRDERSAGDWVEFSYDAAGRIETQRSAPAIEERYTYDHADRIVRIKYSGGREVTFDYTPSGRLQSETWSSGETRSWHYDADGALVEFVDANGLRTAYFYDAQGRRTAQEDSIHGKVSVSHPSASVTGIESAALGRSSSESTALGQPLTSTGPDGRRTVFRYDAGGRLQSVIPPSGFAWRYEHDAEQRLAAILSPGGMKTQIARDAAGRPLTVTRGGMAWRQYRYDAAGRLLQEFSAAGPAATHKYGAGGGRIESELPGGKVAYAADANGLHTTLKSESWQIEEYFHGDGTLARRIYEPAKMDLKLPRDAHGRPAGVELNELKSAYIYNARGQVSRIDLPGGAAITLAYDEAGRATALELGSTATVKIAYDQADRVVAIEAKQPAGNAIFSERCSYDAAGNVAQRTVDSGPPQKYGYDAANQLTKIDLGKQTYTLDYDIDGNLACRTTDGHVRRWVPDKLGRPAQQGATAFAWDAAGNLARAQSAFSKVENEFDAAGRLVRRSDGKDAWTFGYLPDGDRLWMQAPAGKRWYAHLSDRLAGFRDAQNTTWLLVCLPGTDHPLAMCGSDGRTFFFIPDRMGSTRRLLDTKGAVVTSVNFTPYGNIDTSSGTVRFAMFAGMLRDDTGLFYARQRYYDPQMQRFISMDPLIGTPGVPASHNAYAYAANNPLRYRDPQGAAYWDEVVYENYQHTEYLKDAAGNVLHDPNTKEALIDRTSRVVAGAKNNGYDMLTHGEKAAVREAYMAQKAAERALQNPASTAEQVRAAAAAVAQRNAELARLNEIGKLRYGHTLMNWADQKVPGVLAKEKMAEYAGKMKQLGVDPLEHYSEQARATLEQSERAAANEAALAARRAWGVGKSNTAQVVKEEAAAQTGAEAAKGTQQVAADAAAAAARSQQLEKALANNEAIELSKAEVQAIKQAAAERAAARGAAEGGGISAARLAEIDRAMANNEALILSKAEAEALRAQGKAANAAAAKSAENAAARGTGEAAGHAAEEAAEGTLAWLARGAKGALRVAAPVLQALGAAADTYLIAETDYYAGKMYGAEGDALKARQLAKEIRKKLEEEIRRIAKEEPGRLLPLPDGRTVDPNNPQDIDEVIIGMSQNLWKKKGPFEGLVKPKEFGPDAAKNDPTKPKEGGDTPGGDAALEAALEKARGLVQIGYTAEKAAREAGAEVAKQEAEAQSQLQSAVTVAGVRAIGESGLAQVPVAANDVQTQTAAVISQTQSLQTALSMMTAAGSRCEQAATKICGMVAQAATATDEQIKTMRADATNELSTASSALNDAQAKIDGAGVAGDRLRTSIGVLGGFRTSLTNYKIGSGIANGAGVTPDGALAAAKAAANAAVAARARLAPLLDQIRPIPQQVNEILAPFAANPSAGIVNATAAGIGKGIEAPGMFDFSALLAAATPVVEAALGGQRTVEQAIGKVDMDAILSAGNEALRIADELRASASALSTGPERYQALQRATHCFGEIKSGAAPADAVTSTNTGEKSPGLPGTGTGTSGTSGTETGPMVAGGTTSGPSTETPPTTPPPPPPPLGPTSGGTANDDVTVPNLAVFDNVSEMKAVLAHAGLTGSFSAKGQPPKKEMEFKFAGQSPAPDTKVKRGTVVSISIYQKFDDTAAAMPGGKDTIPDVSGLSLDAAQAKLAGAGLSIGGISEGGKAPAEEKANTIKGTTPASGEKIPATKTVMLIKWGAFKDKPAGPPDELGPPTGRSAELEGEWVGTATTVAAYSGGVGQVRGRNVRIRLKDGRFFTTLPGNATLPMSFKETDEDQLVDGNRITYEKKGKDSDGPWVVRVVVQTSGDKMIGFATMEVTGFDSATKTYKLRMMSKEVFDLKRRQD